MDAYKTTSQIRGDSTDIANVTKLTEEFIKADLKVVDSPNIISYAVTPP